MSNTSELPQTMQGLFSLAVERHADRVALRQRGPGGWRATTYAEMAETVQATALGLVDLGLACGERVALLCTTRQEWTFASFAVSLAGGVVVPIYPTSSAQECEWVLSDSGAVAVICEDGSQVDKVLAVRARLARLPTVLTVEPVAGLRSLDEIARQCAGADHSELDRRADVVRGVDPYTIIYTSGTTGPPKGCILSHDNLRAVLGAVVEHHLLSEPDDVTYLYLPLAHALALIMQLSCFAVGGAITYAGGDPRQILAELGEVAPTFLPSVPRIFEKVYAAATRDLDPVILREAVRVGGAVEDLRRCGAPIPTELRDAYSEFDTGLFGRVRAAFGGRLRLAVTGAAPIAPEILELFWASGVPVMEGYGMTETASAISICTLAAHRFGTVGRPVPGVEVRIAEDGEILVRGANVFQGYHDAAEGAVGTRNNGWLHTGDLGSLDADGFLSITGRKKDIIITAGGKNLTPANLENDLKQSPWISHALMHGDRRPYPIMLITLDEEEMSRWAEKRGIPGDLRSLAQSAVVRELVQAELDRANAKYARVEQAKRFLILDHDLSQQAGELTPTLKVKRDVVNQKYASLIDQLYAHS
jgi:long-chain acyl-CoA synthetase